MAEIKIRMDNILVSAEQLAKPENTVSSVRQALNTIKAHIPDTVLNRNGIRNEFESIGTGLLSVRSTISSVKSLSANAMNLYREAELRNQRTASVCLSALTEKRGTNSSAFHEANSGKSG